MTTSPCQLISETLGELFICSEVKGFTRIRTPYLYPDGDVIDLFYKISQGRGIITDLGETIRWLLSQTVTDYLSKKQEQAIQDILLTQFDDSFDVWNAEIISQLEEFSDVAYWSDTDQFFDMLVSE